MTKTRLYRAATAILFTLLFLASHAAASDTRMEVPRMTVDQLNEILENPDVVVLDVRVEIEAKQGEPKIKGAIRKEPRKATDWGAGLDRNKTYVLYCS